MYPTKILLATDGSKESAPALRTAVELAAATGSQLHVVHAISTASQRPYPRAYARGMREAILHRTRLAALALLDEKVSQVEEMGGTVAGSYYREGQPVEEVLRLSDELGVGLIVTGGRIFGRLERFFASSFCEELLLRAECPVLMVRGSKH
jgi:nucleotide-binding universal stress UspA family protein